jgi:modulator of FtsH protease HflC
MRRLVIGLFTGIVVLILFVVLFTFVRRPYEDILLDRFGTLIPPSGQARIMYNWYFKLPTDGVIRIDRRLHLKTLPLQEFVTNGAEPVNVRTFVVWRITDPRLFKEKADGKDERAEEIMQTSILSLVGQQLGSHTLDEFFSTKAETEENTRKLEKQIASDATRGFNDGKSNPVPGLKDIGVEVADIGFSRMAFPPDNTNAVYQRMVAALNEKARKFESEGLKEAEVIRAEGLRNASKTIEEAKAKAEKIKGEGDSEALKILAEVNQTESARELYKYWKNLEILKATLNKNLILVLSTEDSFVSRLFTAPAGGPLSPVPPLVAPTGGGVMRRDAGVLPPAPDTQPSRR